MSTFETNLKNLKTLHAKYAAKVKKLAAQRDALAAKLADATDKELQLADSIAVLENRPTLTKMLTDAIQKPAAISGMPNSIGAASIMEKIPESGNPPPFPPEPGFRWVKGETGEWVLIAQNPNITDVAENAASILLPAVDETSDFTDGELDMMQ